MYHFLPQEDGGRFSLNGWNTDSAGSVRSGSIWKPSDTGVVVELTLKHSLGLDLGTLIRRGVKDRVSVTLSIMYK